MTKNEFKPVAETTMKRQRKGERQDLQRLLKSNIDVIADDVLVIAEEFSDWAKYFEGSHPCERTQ